MSHLEPVPDWLFFERQMAVAEVCSLPCGTSAVVSRPSPDKTTPNEDAAAVIACGGTGAVLIVADGLGGGVAGEQAARQAILSVQAEVGAAVRRGSSLRTGILDGLELANRAVQNIGGGAATTLAAVEIEDRTVRPYHVGDSMILIVGGRGKMKLQTVSHSPVGYAVEAGLLHPHDAMHHAERHVVSNVVGSPSMRIEIGPSIPLAPRDTVLLASDGLFDNLHIPEIVQLLRTGTLAACATSLADSATHRMREPSEGNPSKPDDLTLVLYRGGRRERPADDVARLSESS